MAKQSQVHYYNEAVEKQMGFAAAVRTGDTLRLSGIISTDMEMNVIGEGDMLAQITQVYDTMEKVLAMQGATFENVVNEVIYATDLAALAEPAVLGARAARYANCAPPAATAVQVAGLISPGVMIEIQVTAVLD